MFAVIAACPVFAKLDKFLGQHSCPKIKGKWYDVEAPNPNPNLTNCKLLKSD